MPPASCHAVLLATLAGAAALGAPGAARAADGEPFADAAPLDHGKLSVCDATPIGAGALELSLAWTPTWTRPGPAGLDAPEHGTRQPVALALTAGALLPLSGDVGVSLGLQRAVWGRNAVQHTAAMVVLKASLQAPGGRCVRLVSRR